jgi:hypothetical protein
MKTTWILRLSGLCCVVGGGGLVTLFVSQGGCLGDDCYGRALPGTGPGEAALGLATVGFLIAAAVGLVAEAGRRAPVGKAGLAAALCAAGGALFLAAAGVTAARTGGESWLMPVFVFPLFLVTAAVIGVAAVVLRAKLVPRWMAVGMIVAASLLPLFQQQTPGNFMPVPLGVVCMVLGTHLIVRGGRSRTHVDEPRQPAAG